MTVQITGQACFMVKRARWLPIRIRSKNSSRSHLLCSAYSTASRMTRARIRSCMLSSRHSTYRQQSHGVRPLPQSSLRLLVRVIQRDGSSQSGQRALRLP